jgi:hypothetical protein
VPPQSDAPVDGVGQNKHSVSSVRGVDTASRNNKRLCFKAFVFQLRKHLVECQTDDARHVFTNDVQRADFPYDS